MNNVVPLKPPDYVPNLSAVWFDYRRAKKLKLSTEAMYAERLAVCFSDWMTTPITRLTKIMIEERHRTITRDRGAATANISLRIIRAMMNFAQVRYETNDGEPILKQNPVLILSRTGSWNKENTRVRTLPVEHMAAWYLALRKVKSRDAQDFLLFILMTGCRLNEAAKLQWRDVDFGKKEITFRNTKNGKDHRLPACQYLMRMLERRSMSIGCDAYVFQNRSGKPYHLHPGVLSRLARMSGITITAHDLRRTYATLAHAIGVDPLNIKRLLNHTSNDVTWRYIIYNPDVYRREVEVIGAGLTMLLGINTPDLFEQGGPDEQ